MVLATPEVSHKPVNKEEMNVNVNLSHWFELLKKGLRCESPLKVELQFSVFNHVTVNLFGYRKRWWNEQMLVDEQKELMRDPLFLSTCIAAMT